VVTEQPKTTSETYFKQISLLSDNQINKNTDC